MSTASPPMGATSQSQGIMCQELMFQFENWRDLALDAMQRLRMLSFEVDPEAFTQAGQQNLFALNQAMFTASQAIAAGCW